MNLLPHTRGKTPGPTRMDVRGRDCISCEFTRSGSANGKATIGVKPLQISDIVCRRGGLIVISAAKSHCLIAEENRTFHIPVNANNGIKSCEFFTGFRTGIKGAVAVITDTL